MYVYFAFLQTNVFLVPLQLDINNLGAEPS